MRQFLGFGDGSDGDVIESGTDAPIDSSCSGSSGSSSLSATNGSFAAGQMILILQMRGANAGYIELNKIQSYTPGTITTEHPLEISYSSTGNDAAQVIVIAQHSSYQVTTSLLAKAWDPAAMTGGVVVKMASGKITVSGTLNATGKGFLGGRASIGTSEAGEGSAGPRVNQSTPNGSGGGGSNGAYGGGGGANATDGAPNNPGSILGGYAAGSADLITILMGGGGGGGNFPGADAPAGGGIIILIAPDIEVTGFVLSDGVDGTASSAGCSGGSAAGSILFICRTGVLGTNLVNARKGNGGTNGTPGYNGGDGSVGRIAARACELTGTTNPAANETIGGLEQCIIGGSIY